MSARRPKLRQGGWLRATASNRATDGPPRLLLVIRVHSRPASGVVRHPELVQLFAEGPGLHRLAGDSLPFLLLLNVASVRADL